MSITTTLRKAGPFQGNNSTTVFPFAFKVFQISDLKVIQADSASIETVLELTTDYSVSINANQDANPGGSITLVVPTPTGNTLTILSNMSTTQELVLTNLGGFFPEVVNDAFDKLTILLQQLSERVDRALTFPTSSGLTPEEWYQSIVANAGGLVLPIAPAQGGTGSTNLASVTVGFATHANLADVASNAVAGPTIVGTASKLALSATGTNATITVSADEVALETATGLYLIARAVALAINTATVGANGLDTGALTVSTWYAVYIISNGSTVAGLISLSATAPTMPAGYTYKARVGWIRSEAGSNKYPLAFIQKGGKVRYKPTASSNLTFHPHMINGTSGTLSSTVFTPTAIAVGNYVPPTASIITLQVANHLTGNYAAVAPSANYAGWDAGTAVPIVSNPDGTNFIVDMMLESTNVYYASTSVNGYLACLGWEDER
jgi:hypothetical protein